MKLIHEPEGSPPITSHEFRREKMQIIDEEGQYEAIRTMRDRIYTNKVRAFVREYMANAIDANMSNEAESPILVTAPTALEPVFKVRDFGTGLNENDCFFVFGGYFNSTKRDSNTAIGGMGIGAKSGHAYGDLFNITSFHEGKMSVYSAVLRNNEKGRREGWMEQMGEMESDEPSGIEISVPIKESDILTVHQEIQYLAPWFKRYYPNIEFVNLAIPEVKTVFEQENYIIVRRNQTPIQFKDALYILMGGILYPCDYSKLQAPSLFSKIFQLYGSNALILPMNIGDVSLPPSREGVELSPTTIENIKAKIAQVEEVRSHVQSSLKFDNLSSFQREKVEECSRETGRSEHKIALQLSEIREKMGILSQTEQVKIRKSQPFRTPPGHSKI